MESPTKKKPQSEHYVNNAEFSAAVVEYVTKTNAAEASGTEPPRISDYIGRCFLKIAEGLSRKSNFIQYTYREEMVMDAVENCIKSIGNYNVAAATRTGSPNAFAYFTQICYYAFLRRIAKEKKQQDIKLLFIEHAGIEDFMTESENGSDVIYGTETGFIDTVKSRIDRVKTTDRALKLFKKKIRKESPPLLFASS